MRRPTHTPASQPCHHPIPPYRSTWDNDDGPLQTIATTLPRLLELTLEVTHVDNPTAMLPHLTRLELDTPCEWIDTELRLARCAPQLRVLECDRSSSDTCNELTLGHPLLRELSVTLPSEEYDCKQDGDLMRTITELPSLAELHLDISPTGWDEERSPYSHVRNERLPDGMARPLRLAQQLAPCTQLTKLHIGARSGTPLHDLMATLGAWLGKRLRSLTIERINVPLDPAEAAMVFYLLPACYPGLETLVLDLETQGASDECVEALMLAMLQPLQVLLPQCRALQGLKVLAYGRYTTLPRARALGRALSSAYPRAGFEFSSALW